MSNENTKSPDSLQRRVNAEMIDSFDEELEMELDDDRVSEMLKPTEDYQSPESMDRHLYFRELFHLQRELVKLQDWVSTRN
jgi:polyphosphate kinase 2 (PPK2 family)